MMAEHSTNQLINELTTSLTTNQPINQLTTCGEVSQEFLVSLITLLVCQTVHSSYIIKS